MSDREPRPSRVVVWLLERVSSRHAARANVGDILEELAARTAEGRAPQFPSLWVNAAVAAPVVASLRLSVPRGLRALGHTLRDAARALRRSPAHSLFILFVLALAISAATVTFSVVDAVVLRPLPLEHPEAIVQVTGRRIGRDGRDLSTVLTPQQFWTVHDQVPAFESVAPARSWRLPVSAGAAERDAQVMRSTAALFDVLRLKPAIGRVWTRDEEGRGNGADVAVLSFRFWQNRLHGDPEVINHTVTIADRSYRIVGVLTESADRLETVGWKVDVWTPDVPPQSGPGARGGPPFFTLARLRPGMSIDQAESQVSAVLLPPITASAAATPEWRSEVAGWQASMIGPARGWMLLILAAVALLVFIGCINAANVMLTRSTERARELAVRASLGASRQQIATSLLAESLMLSMAASACALALAGWGVAAAKAMLPAGMFRVDAIAVNGRVFVMSIVAAIASGLLFGMAPAWVASRASLVALIKDGGPTGTARRSWRSGLLAAQIGCITVLLVVATLFVASFVQVLRVDLGLDRAHLLGIEPRAPFRGTADEVERRLRTAPGVVDVAVVTNTSLPLVAPVFGGGYNATAVRSVEGSGASPEVLVYRVTPNYFAVTNLPFRRGSTWHSPDAPGVTPIVIDEVVARRLFGTADPLGRLITGDALKTEFTVVGVVPFVRSRGPEAIVQPAVYAPLTADPSRQFAGFFVRTKDDPGGLIPAVQSALTDLAPEGDRPYIHVVDEAFRQLTATRRFNATLMSLFALFAMFIGAAGIYGVMASLVAQRTREFGVRIALGASASDIRRGLLAQVGRHLAVGLALGLPAAWWISRAFAALFFEVRPTDLSIYVVVTLLLAAVAVVAALVPARRASRVDPIVSLRAS